MKFCIDITKLDDPDMCGETLLHSINNKVRWGRWTTVSMCPWDELELPANWTNKFPEAVDVLYGDDDESDRSLGLGVTLLRNTSNGTLVFHRNDGDDIIVFRIPGEGLLANFDAKKPYNWNWVY